MGLCRLGCSTHYCPDVRLTPLEVDGPAHRNVPGLDVEDRAEVARTSWVWDDDSLEVNTAVGLVSLLSDAQRQEELSAITTDPILIGSFTSDRLI